MKYLIPKNGGEYVRKDVEKYMHQILSLSKDMYFTHLRKMILLKEIIGLW